MTESNTMPQGILLRVEMVRARMQSWGLTSGAGYIDPADPATIDPADSRYVRANLTAVPAYYDRIRAEAETSAEPDDLEACGAGPASERLETNDVCL